MKSFLRLCCLVGVFVVVGGVKPAFGQVVVEGISWGTWPDDDRVDKCKGNCGAACSGTFAICGGEQTWEFTLEWYEFTGRTGNGQWQPLNYDDSLGCTWGWEYDEYHDTYQGGGRWTYHGVYSNFCSNHDWACWAFFPYCLAPGDIAFACWGAHLQDWSYSTWIYGTGPETREYSDITCQ